MKIIYNPYFSSHPYVDITSGGTRIGVKYANTSELLSQLELRLGVSYSDLDSTREIVAEYHKILDKCIPQGHMLRQSFEIDDEIDIDEKEKELIVSKTILEWRNTLILAGWDGKTQLEGSKLGVISKTEKMIPEDSIIHQSEADRWKALLTCDISMLPEPIEIEVLCPSILVPSLIQKVLERFSTNYTFAKSKEFELNIDKASIIKAKDVTETYEWLANRKPQKNEVIVCEDTDRLDCILRALHKPMAGDAQVGCHQTISDPRDMVDAPKSLVWIDCYGDYGLKYPYDFMNTEEIDSVNAILSNGYSIPTKINMLKAVQQHLYVCLNNVTNSIIFVSAGRDIGAILPEHPIVTWLEQKGVDTKEASTMYGFALTPEKDEIRFCPQAHYVLNGCNADRKDVTMSYSTMETLIQTPFDFVVEREADMYDANGLDDIQTLLGKIAHKVVELMVKGDGLSIDTYEEQLEEAITEIDTEEQLKQSQYMFTVEEFHASLKQSIEVLIGIINDNKLAVVASEMKIPSDESGKDYVELQGIGKVKGFIDLVLKNDQNKYFIFDFKYSRSRRHPDKLAECKSIQFETYRRLFDQYSGMGKIKAMGYYLFPLGTLFMSEEDYKKSGFIGEHIESVAIDRNHQLDTWNALCRSYKFRKEQISKGLIEEGEGMDLSLFDYTQHEDLFKLEHAYGDDKCKAAAYSNKHIVLKNQIR